MIGALFKGLCERVIVLCVPKLFPSPAQRLEVGKGSGYARLSVVTSTRHDKVWVKFVSVGKVVVDTQFHVQMVG